MKTGTKTTQASLDLLSKQEKNILQIIEEALLKRVLAKAGLPENFRPLHGLRHSFASWLVSSGQVSMYELQKLLTHSRPQMTQRYAHLHDDATPCI